MRSKPFWYALFEGEGASDVILSLIEKDYSFTDEAILKFFELDKAEEVLEAFINQGHYLQDAAQNKLFELKNAAALVDELATHFSLCESTLQDIFKFPEAENIFANYIRAHRHLPESVQHRLFSQPNARKFIDLMIDEKYVLAEAVEVRIFQQEDPFDLARRYVVHYALRKPALKQVCMRQDSAEFLEYYIQNTWYPWNGGEYYLLQRPDAEHLLELFIETGKKITNEIAFLDLFEKPYGERLYQRYVEKNGETVVPFSVRLYLKKQKRE